MQVPFDKRLRQNEWDCEYFIGIYDILLEYEGMCNVEYLSKMVKQIGIRKSRKSHLFNVNYPGISTSLTLILELH